MLRRRFLTMLAVLIAKPSFAEDKGESVESKWKIFGKRSVKLPDGGSAELVIHTLAILNEETKRTRLVKEQASLEIKVANQFSRMNEKNILLLGMQDGNVVEYQVDGLAVKSSTHDENIRFFNLAFDWDTVLDQQKIENQTFKYIKSEIYFVDGSGKFITDQSNLNKMNSKASLNTAISYLIFNNGRFGIGRKIRFYQMHKGTNLSASVIKDAGPMDFVISKSVDVIVWAGGKVIPLASIDSQPISQLIAQASKISEENLENIAAGKGSQYLGGCAITTATCELLGFDDNCFELTQLRAFRDRFVSDEEEKVYRQLSKKILSQGAFTGSHAKQHARALYARYIFPGAILAWLKMDKYCYRLYKAMVLKLSKIN